MVMKIDKVGKTWFCTILHAGKPVATGRGFTKEDAITAAQLAYDSWKSENAK